MSERGEEEKDRGFVVIDRRSSASGSEDEPAPAPRAQAQAAPPPRTAPRVDFAVLVHSFFVTALYHLGAAPDPETGRTATPNPALARQNIDILELIEEKTRGNLTPDEAGLLEGLLYEARMRFVEATKPPGG
ncbi:MAG TPA: DUF1844 domain-containing protein [Myxococcota bacterium]|nr:DUF1844 domain-containing protein [Myxococcota bacterium]